MLQAGWSSTVPPLPICDLIAQPMHDLEDSRAAVKCDLAAAVIRSSGELRLKVTGSSMLPSIWPGDILTIRRQNLDQIRPGEIVLVARDGGLCAHGSWPTAARS